MGMNTEEWFEYRMDLYHKLHKEDDLLTFLLHEIKSLTPYNFNGALVLDYFKIQKLADEAIKIINDIPSNRCPECGKVSMEDVRPGKRQCRDCG